MGQNKDLSRSKSKNEVPDPSLENQLVETHKEILAQDDSSFRIGAIDPADRSGDAEITKDINENVQLASLKGLLNILEKMRRSRVAEISQPTQGTPEPRNAEGFPVKFDDRSVERLDDSEVNLETPRAVATDTYGDSRALFPANEDTDDAAGDSVTYGFANASEVTHDEAELDSFRGLRIGRFQVRSGVGQGGFGMVFTAYDDRLDRVVALKVPRPEAILSLDQRRRFLREGRAAAALSHPNIVGVLEAGEDGPICYIASELIKGVNLGEWLRRHGPMNATATAQLISTLAEAIQHAHSRHVLHRDLKPNNILMSGDKPWITDFGLALRLDQNLETSTSELIVGTPGFMAPEQATGKFDGIDGRADVYGLGAILYYMLTNRPPFSADSPLETLDMVRQQIPVPPRAIRKSVSRDLESICLKCLEKSSADRYDSAYDLHMDLQRFLDEKPVLARPVPRWQRVLRWSKRNPLLSLVGSAALLFLAISLITSYLGWTSTSKALSEARLANKATMVAQHQSDERFLAAKQTVDDYFTQVANNRMLNIPGLTSLRHELLQSALHYYVGFLAQSEDDEALLSEIERAHFRLGEIHADLGQPDAALENFMQSEQLLRQLLAQTPEELTRLLLLNGSLARIASQHMVLGNPNEAMSTLNGAIEGQQILFANQPLHFEVLNQLANLWQQKGTMLREMRQPDESQELYEMVVGLREQLLATNQENEDLKRELLISKGNLANARRATGNLAEAIALSDEVVVGLREFASRPNTTPADNHTLLKFLYNRSLLAMMGRNFEGARETLDEATAIADDLANVFPAVEAHVRDPAIMRGALAVACLELGEIEEALENFRLNEQACDQLVELNPASVNNLIDAGLAKLNYGAALGNHAKDFLAARARVTSAQQLFESVLDRNPGSFNARMGMVNCEVNLAAFAVELETWELVLEHSEQALELSVSLREEHANNPQLRHAISQTYTNLANALENLARVDESIAAWQFVVESAFPEPSPLHRLRLAAALALGDRLEKAEELLELVVDQLGQRGSLWMQQGRCFALIAQALRTRSTADGQDRESSIGDFSQRAISSLQTAVELGYFESPKWRHYLEQSSELDELRSRAEFQALLDELEFSL